MAFSGLLGRSKKCFIRCSGACRTHVLGLGALCWPSQFLAVCMVLCFPFEHCFPLVQGTSVFFSAILIAYIYVTAAGVIFWRQPNKTRPLMCALAIQIPWISPPGLVYKFSAGLYIFVAIIAEHHGDKYSAGLNGKFN